MTYVSKVQPTLHGHAYRSRKLAMSLQQLRGKVSTQYLGLIDHMVTLTHFIDLNELPEFDVILFQLKRIHRGYKWGRTNW